MKPIQIIDPAGAVKNTLLVKDDVDPAKWRCPLGCTARAYEPEPEPPPEPVIRRQTVHTVLKRLTRAEYRALKTSNNVELQIATDIALAEGIISEADEDFAPFVAGCDALGIIAASRWEALLAP